MAGCAVMANVRPLSGPTTARCTLAQRLTRRVDRIRQIATKLGARSRRVYLVWVEVTGETAGSGQETILARRELLPTPRVSDLTAVMRRPMSIGIVADGSLRVDQISAGWYTEDHLRGIKVPDEYGCPNEQQYYPGHAVSGTRDRELVRDPNSFFYEIVEDGRGDDPPMRRRYRLSAAPWRNETGVMWGVVLEPMSSDNDRTGNPTLGVDDVLD